jgi:L-asparaginase
MERIRIIATGGTIDKEYDQLTGELIFSRSHLTTILDQARCTLPSVIETLMLKDSLFMVEDDRRLVLERCRASAERRIIVTHGTDTMAETAALLGPHLSGRTVVLVGAMILFNLGCAFAAVQTLAEGVYITMNGRIFGWSDVRKNRDKGVFQTLAED